jgi:hypothetical protein
MFHVKHLVNAHAAFPPLPESAGDKFAAQIMEQA